MTEELIENVPSDSASAPKSAQESEVAAAHSPRWRRRTWLLLAVVGTLIAVLIVPPLVSLGRYQGRITELISTALGRPVRLSSVEMRLLPRPAFVLYDLVVEDDPAYGSEPVLHANSVTASIRLWSLWRGRLEISGISVDEASLNLVRTDQGRWNVDPFFRNAATGSDQAASNGTENQASDDLSTLDKKLNFPSLEATNSRINFKQGVEKLPFSLTNTKLSFWQAEPGNWRIRLRGEPVRTDLSLDGADTGELRLEATLHRAAELRQVPLQLEMEWRKAQLGQLTRLLLGNDAGWRGDLTGNLSLTGTAGEAHVKTRLQASNVRRAEFVPTSPMDFDANCNFTYHATGLSIEKLICDSPLGNGKIHLMGNLHGMTIAANSSLPTDTIQTVHLGSMLSIELNQIPVAAGLDALRTVRAELLPGIDAKGTISGELTYAEPLTAYPPQNAKKNTRRGAVLSRASIPGLLTPGPLTGALTIQGLTLTGGSLGAPIQIAKIQFEPVAAQAHEPLALATVFPVDAGGAAPVIIALQLQETGYHLTAKGTASTTRALQMTTAAGVAQRVNTPAIQGGIIVLDLTAEGPWVETFAPHPDHLSGTAVFHNTHWNTAFLMNPIELSSATLRFGESGANWESASFTYGALQGTGSLQLPPECETPCILAAPTPAHFMVQLHTLDAKTLETSLLGAQTKGTMLENLLARLRPNNPPNWPLIAGVIHADTLALGPVTLIHPTLELRIHNDHATLTALDAKLLGGTVHATGELSLASGKPDYSLNASFSSLKPQEVGKLVSQSWAGSAFDSSGELTLQGYTGKELAATAKGSLRFNWNGGAGHHGKLGGNFADPVPASLTPLFAHFDQWSGEALVNNGSLTMGQNMITNGPQSTTVDGSILLSERPRFHFAEKPVQH